MKSRTCRAVGSSTRTPVGAAAGLSEKREPPHIGSTGARAPSKPRSGVRIACAVALFAMAGVVPAGAPAASLEVEEGRTVSVEVRKTWFVATVPEFLGGAAAGGCRVDYRYETRGGTAQEQIDFEHISGQLTFWPGERSKTLKIETNEDRCKEDDETFSVELTGGKATAFGAAANYVNCGIHEVPSTISVGITIKDVPSESGSGGSYEEQKYGCGGGGDGVQTYGE